MSTATPPPIPGAVLDPPAKSAPKFIERLSQRPGTIGVIAGVGYRAFLRFSLGRASLLAAGTTYYVFLAMFSILTLGYGLTAAIGSAEVAAYMTEALNKAFPGLLGNGPIDPDRLRQIGQSMSIVGAVGLLYGGTGAILAVKNSLHAIYGAPNDPRNVVIVRLLAVVWLILVGPLLLLSFVGSTVAANLSDSALARIGWSADWVGDAFTTGSVLLSLLIDALIVALILGFLGGIRPRRRALWTGAIVGAILIELLKWLMAWLLGFAIDKPQYGAFAAPIGIMFVLYLQCMALYGAGSVAAGVADLELPLDVLTAADIAALQQSTAGGEGAVPEEPAGG